MLPRPSLGPSRSVVTAPSPTSPSAFPKAVLDWWEIPKVKPKAQPWTEAASPLWR